MASNQKERLFDQGAQAAANVLGTKDTYFCPICGERYSTNALDSGQLTLEHVPPKSLGGKGLILTCRSCNNVAGYTIDANAAGRSELNRFTEVILGEGAGSAGATVLTIGEYKVRVEVSNDGTTTAFNVIGAANNPATVEKAMDELRRAAEDGSLEGFKMQVTKSVRYNPRKAKVSDLRTAFLACTAKLGYRFAFSKALEAIREQILQPDEELIPKWSVKLSNPVSAPAMAIASDKGLVVVLLESGAVLLPWPPAGEDGLRKTYAEADKDKKVTFQASPLGWPRSFDAILDWDETNAP